MPAHLCRLLLVTVRTIAFLGCTVYLSLSLFCHNQPPSIQRPSLLAIWWFVHPHVAREFAEFVKDTLGHATGLADFKPEARHFVAMWKFGDEHRFEGRSSVLSHYQGAGDIVQVPPGWPHAVCNLANCCKLAWDYYDIQQLSNYVVAHRDVASPPTLSRRRDCR